MKPKWNENQTVLATAVHIPETDKGSLEGAASWELEFGECGVILGRGLLLTDQGEVREEIVMGNACGGRPGSHRSKVIRLSHT